MRHLIIGRFDNDPNLGARYNRWYEKCESGIDSYHSIEVFANANAGFALSNSKTAVEDYPSVVDMGYAGKGVRLTTCSTGPWGLLVRRPLAAGNFFIGEFDVEQALDNTLHTSRMGRVFDRKPYKVEGYYKYKAGKEFWKFVKGNVEKHTEIKDRAAIYAVFYRNRDAEGKEVMLFGEDSKTNPNIVAIAVVMEVGTGEILAVANYPSYNLSTYAKDYSTLIETDYNPLFNRSCEGLYAIGSTFKPLKATGDSASKRLEIKHLIAEMSKINPQVEQNIFKSVENVNLSTVIAYKDKQGERHHFLDEY